MFSQDNKNLKEQIELKKGRSAGWNIKQHSQASINATDRHTPSTVLSRALGDDLTSIQLTPGSGVVRAGEPAPVLMSLSVDSGRRGVDRLR